MNNYSLLHYIVIQHNYLSSNKKEMVQNHFLTIDSIRLLTQIHLNLTYKA